MLTLSHTGARVVIPLVRYELAVTSPAQRGRGVMPDHTRDVAASFDDRVLIARVLDLIAKGSR